MLFFFLKEWRNLFCKMSFYISPDHLPEEMILPSLRQFFSQQLTFDGTGACVLHYHTGAVVLCEGRAEAGRSAAP